MVVSLTMRLMLARTSAAGEGAGCQGSWFDLLARPTKSSTPPGLMNRYPTCRKHKAVTCHWLASAIHCMAKYTLMLPLGYPANVECVAHPAKESIMPTFILLSFYGVNA